MDTKQMKDMLGYEVQVGDKVVISRTGCRELLVATVTKLTPKGIKAKYRDAHYPEDSRWAFTETQRSLGMFVKVREPSLMEQFHHG